MVEQGAVPDSDPAAHMTILSFMLVVLGTMLMLIVAVASANIYDVPPVICYACRWAVILWLGLAVIAMWVGAFVASMH